MLLCKHSFAIIHSAYVWQSECGTCYCWFICIKTLYHYGYHTFPLLNSPGIYHQRTFHILQATYNLVQIVLLLHTYQHYFQFFRVCFFLIHIFTGGKKKAIQKQKKNSCIFSFNSIHTFDWIFDLVYWKMTCDLPHSWLRCPAIARVHCKFWAAVCLSLDHRGMCFWVQFGSDNFWVVQEKQVKFSQGQS